MVAYRIGRGSANDIVVEDSSVSRNHAELRVSDETCVLVDLGSTNGTCVRENGRWIEIEKASVTPDERILLGEVVTTVTALIEKRNHEPKSLGIRSARADEFTAPGRSGRDGAAGEEPGLDDEPDYPLADAPAEPHREALPYGDTNDHARLVGRRRRAGAGRPGGSRRAQPAPRREPEPPSRGPIVYSGIAARLNGTPDAGPDRPDPSLRRSRAEAAASGVRAAPRPSPAAKAQDAAREGKPKSTPYLQVPPRAAATPSARPTPEGVAVTPSRTHAPGRPNARSRWFALAAVGSILAVGAMVTGLHYGDGLVGMLGFGADTRAQVAAAPPRTPAAPVAPAVPSKPKLTWQRFVGGPRDDTLANGARYRDGGAILVGTTAAGLPASADLWAVRLDPEGKVLWRRAFGGDKADRGLAVAAAADGGAIVAGAGEDRQTAWVLRLDRNGQKLWERKLKVGAKGAVTAAAALDTGGFAVVVVGRTTDGVRTDLVRFDPEGKELWRRQVGRDGIRGTDLLAVRDSGFALVGLRDGARPVLWAARLDPDGRISWERTLKRSGTDARAFLRLARRDDLIVATTHLPEVQQTPGGLLRLVRLDRHGETIWDHTVKARSGLEINGLFLVRRGIIVAGVEQGETPWVARVDTNGTVVWERRFEALKTGRANTIVERSRGRMLVAGRIDRGDARKHDGLLLFLDRRGRPDQ